jgi:hypothetical protein
VTDRKPRDGQYSDVAFLAQPEPMAYFPVGPLKICATLKD